MTNNGKGNVMLKIFEMMEFTNRNGYPSYFKPRYLTTGIKLKQLLLPKGIIYDKALTGIASALSLQTLPSAGSGLAMVPSVRRARLRMF